MHLKMIPLCAYLYKPSTPPLIWEKLFPRNHVFPLNTPWTELWKPDFLIYHFGGTSGSVITPTSVVFLTDLISLHSSRLIWKPITVNSIITLDFNYILLHFRYVQLISPVYSIYISRMLHLYFQYFHLYFPQVIIIDTNFAWSSSTFWSSSLSDDDDPANF